MHHSDYMEDFNNAIGYGIGKQLRDFQVNNRDLFDNNVMKPNTERDVSGVLVERDVQVDELVDQVQSDGQVNIKKKHLYWCKNRKLIGLHISFRLRF